MAESDLASQFNEQRAELVGKIVERGRRAHGPVEGVRDRIREFPVHPRDSKLAELMAAVQCAARGSTHEHGRGRSAEEVDERVPQDPEKDGARNPGCGIAALHDPQSPHGALRWRARFDPCGSLGLPITLQLPARFRHLHRGAVTTRMRDSGKFESYFTIRSFFTLETPWTPAATSPARRTLCDESTKPLS